MSAHDRLVELLAASGLTQAELARRIGEPTHWVNNRVRGVAVITADDVSLLAMGLGVSPSAFYDPSMVPPERTPERAALQQEPALAQSLSAALVKLLVDLAPADRRQLLRTVSRLTGEGASVEIDGAYRKRLVDRVTRRLVRAWDELPEEEQEFLWEMVEARRILRERREAGQARPE